MVSAVVLAAGASTRMGTKLLLPLGGEPLMGRRAVRQVCDAGFDDVLVVRQASTKDAGGARGLAVRHRQRSIRQRHGQLVPHGRRAPGRQHRAMFALADQPFVTTVEYRTVLDTYLQHHRRSSASVTATSAPPHLSEREFFPELAQLQHGARSLLLRHSERTMVVQFPPELLVDIDTPEDYELAKSRFSSGR
jgi:CTP:molybdopterin cytidylyltransferase MocA